MKRKAEKRPPGRPLGKADAKRGHKIANSTVAAEFGVSIATVSRWRNEGKPVEDFPAMRKLLEEKHAAHGRGSGGGGNGSTDHDRAPSDDLARGAASALARLEQDEAQRWAAYQAAKEATADASTQKRLHKQWLEVSESLRKYDLQVEQIRRDAGELLTRAQAEQVLEATATALRLAVAGAAEGFIDDIVKRSSPPTGSLAEGARAMVEAIAKQVPVSLRRMALTVSGCPEWAQVAVKRGMRANG
jgi:hypothetical protein